MSRVVVIGAGLAGSEAAFGLAQQGIEVVLIESKALRPTPAQKLSTAAELVCTNSLKSLAPTSAHGLLKSEMVQLGSLIIEEAYRHRVPAGDALAVNREDFSQAVEKRLRAHPLIRFISREVEQLDGLREEFQADHVVVATGPLTLPALQSWLMKELAPDNLYFYDAIAPVVDAASLDMSKLYFKDRHKVLDGTIADYLNAPMDKQLYIEFMEAMIAAEKVPPKDFEDPRFFESCLPIDLMAERGVETARFGPMTPMGLELVDGKRPYAVVQLRRENLLGEAYNLVGFQTRLTYKEQLRIFRMIPGLENAQFLHLGSVHRNTFLNSKALLNPDLSSKKFPWLWAAGQITGVEGYTESAAMGLYVAKQIGLRLRGEEMATWPVETAMGALVNYIMTWERPVPSNFNFGLLPPLGISKKELRGDRKKAKKELACKRAEEIFTNFLPKLSAKSNLSTENVHTHT